MISFLLLAATAIASVQNPVINKALDGKTIRCEAANDINKVGYRPTTFALVGNAQSIDLKLGIISLECVKTEGSVSWDERPFNAPIMYMTYDGRSITKNMRNQEFRVINAAYELIGAAPVSSESFAMLSYNFGVEKILNSDSLDRLAKGETVSAIISFNLSGFSSYTENGVTKELGQVSGGIYIIRFDLTNTATGLVISNTSFQ